jgi:hypothetical protein
MVLCNRVLQVYVKSQACSEMFYITAQCYTCLCCSKPDCHSSVMGAVDYENALKVNRCLTAGIHGNHRAEVSSSDSSQGSNTFKQAGGAAVWVLPAEQRGSSRIMLREQQPWPAEHVLA